ncbi:hypothetical protein VTK26DRAFT_4816 [Humicola hyalothermophila]
MPPRPSTARLPRRLSLSRLLSNRHQSTTTIAPDNSLPTTYDPRALLSKPTWSIRTLLPPTVPEGPTPSPTTTTTSSSSQQSPQPQPQSPPLQQDLRQQDITPATLHHLHRLSALPPPATPAATASMLSTLRSQLHFVRHIQQVDTSNVPPLASIRDETAAGLAEATIGVETLRAALAEEEVVGKCRRPRRRRGARSTSGSGVGDSGNRGVVGSSSFVGEANGEEGKNKTRIEGEEEWDVLGCATEKAGRYFVVRSGKAAGTEG